MKAKTVGTERGFLDALAAEPNDASQRLVYADWLEDRGDPRGEFLRVLHGLETESVFAPRYWELKCRRNELRPTIDSAWRARVGDADAYAPLFTMLPPARHDRWRLIDRFVDYWHEPLGGEGDVDAEIDHVEATLGVRLPPALKEWYWLNRRRGDIWQQQDWLRRLAKVEIDREHDSLVLRWEHRNYQLCIRQPDLHQDDPPVFLAWAELNGEWKSAIVSPTLSAFAVYTLLTETYFCGGVTMYYFDNPEYPSSSEQIIEYPFAEVRQRLLQCDIPRGDRLSDSIEMFEGRDVLCMIYNKNIRLGILVRNDAALDQFSPDLRCVLTR